MRSAKWEISFPVDVESMKSCFVSTPQFDWDASQTGDNSIINRDSCRYGASVSGHSRDRPLGLGPNQLLKPKKPFTAVSVSCATTGGP